MNRYDFEHPLIPLPEGWSEQTVYEFSGPTIDGMEHHLIVAFDRMLQPEHSDLEAFADHKSEVVVGALDGSEVVSRKLCMLGDCAAVELTLRRVLAAEQIQRLQYFFLIDGNRGVTFSCRYTDKSFKIVCPEVRELIAKLISRS